MNLTVAEWTDREFSPDSRPPQTVVWRWIREGRIPATKLGKRYYIPASYCLSDHTGDPLADRILHGATAKAKQQGTA